MGDDVFIKFSPAREPFVPGENKNKPTGSSNTARNFKKVLEDKSDEKDDGVSSAQAAKKRKALEESEDEANSVASAEEEGETREKAFSLFSQRKGKVALPKQPSQEPKTEEDELKIPSKTLKSTFDAEAESVAAGESKQREAHMRSLAEIKGAEVVVTAAPVHVPVKKELKSIYEGHVRENEEGLKEKTSLFALSAKKSVPDRVKLSAEERNHEAGVFAQESESKKGSIVNPLVREPIDISTVNSNLQSGAIVPPVVAVEIGNVAVAAKAPPMAPSATVSVLIDQLLKELSVMTVGDKTETTLVLKQPPLLEGAQVVITSFDSAKGELNIKFANLTQQAQQMIEQQQQNLMTSLETKGYQVHIFVATTVSEPQIIATDGQPADKERHQRQEQGQGRSKEEKKEQ